MKMKYNKEEDVYSEMTEQAVKELWNNDKYSREGLKNIALLLLDWVENE